MRTRFSFLALGLALATAFGAATAHAATYTEASAPGGAYSGSWASPTEVGAGFENVSGTGNGNAYDNFVFSALPSGKQSLTFTFSAPENVDPWSYSAGGEVLWSTQPFRWNWDGARAGQFQVSSYERTKSFTLDLADDFSGPLYLALNFTHGANLGYNVSAPSNAGVSPAPIPLPAGVLLMGSAVVALGAAGLRRRKATPAAA